MVTLNARLVERSSGVDSGYRGAGRASDLRPDLNVRCWAPYPPADDAPTPPSRRARSTNALNAAVGLRRLG